MKEVKVTAKDRILSQCTREELFAEILNKTFEPGTWDDSAAETSRRFVAYLDEFRPIEPYPFKWTVFETQVNQMVVVKDIELVSQCMHHLLPFWGVAHVAYLPNKLMIGASKIPRLVDFWSRRPQTQEYITSQVATDLKHHLEAQGVAVVVEARHTCMACRGVRKGNAKMVTSEMRGTFLSNPAAKAEFFAMIGLGGV